MTHHIFHGIYFIHAHTGTQLASKQTPTLNFDIDLVTGMFNALESFINHLAYSNKFETLQDINFQGLSIIYERYGQGTNAILCVGVCERDVNPKYAHHYLHELVQIFYTTFSPEIRNFKGDVRPFQQFQLYMNTVFEQIQEGLSNFGLSANIHSFS